MDLIKDLINCDQNKLNDLSDKIYEENRNNIDYWNFMITNTILDDRVILDNFKYLDKELLIKNQKLSKNIILNEYFLNDDKNFLNLLFTCQSLDMDTLEELIKLNDDVDWNLISKFQNLSIFFIDKYKTKLNWQFLSEFQYLPIDYINIMKDKIHFESLGRNIAIVKLIDDKFIEKFKDKNIWDCLIWSDNISNEILLNNLNKLNDSQIQDLLEVKKLDKDILKVILEKYSHIEDIYNYLIEGQDLSEDFIKDNLDKFSKKLLVMSQNLSYEFLYQIRKEFLLEDLSLNENLNEEIIEDILDNKSQFNGNFDVDFIKDNLDISFSLLNRLTSLYKKNDTNIN